MTMTAENIPETLATMIRAAVDDLWNATTPDVREPQARKRRANSLHTLTAIADQVAQLRAGEQRT